jgi:hypothetical protein
MQFPLIAALAGVSLTSAATAQAQPAAVSTTPPAVAFVQSSPCCMIPALTDVRIEIGSTINSQANHIGEHFPIRLVDPIVVDGKTLIPAGAAGSGDIVHADKSRFGGRPGELLLAVRYIEHAGVRIPLRSLRYVEGRGKDRGDAAMAVGIAASSVLAMFITGGEVNIPAGTHALAKTSAAVVVPPSPGSPSSP